MQHNLNSEIQSQLTQAVKDSAWDKLSQLRFKKGDPGDIFYIDNLDLSNRDLSAIPTDFLTFRGCDLTDASFNGKMCFPLSLWSCKATNIDLRNTHGMLFAYDTDLRGAKFDNETELVVSNSDLASAFKDCLMDDDFHAFLTQQGAIFDFPLDGRIESYAFGLTEDKLSRWESLSSL